MGSPSMDHEAGYQQARIDFIRNDQVAVTNHRRKTLDWNIDRTAWTEGYAEYLIEVSASSDAAIASLAAHGIEHSPVAALTKAACDQCHHDARFHHLPCDATPDCRCRYVPAIVRSRATKQDIG